jgi:hypothetical protein
MRRMLKPEPREHDKKVIQRFLLLPMWLRGEFKWLENVNILMEYRHHTEIGCVWDMIEFVDESDVTLPVEKSNGCNVVFVMNFIAAVIGSFGIFYFVTPWLLIVYVIMTPVFFLPTLVSCVWMR